MDKLYNVPQNIREHLGSSKTSAYIDQINKVADIARIHIIASFLFEIATKETSVNDAIIRLKEKIGTTNDKKIKTIARAIKEKILEPIRDPLLKWGVDIEKIDVAGAQTLDEYNKERRDFLESIGIKEEERIWETPKDEEKKISFENFGQLLDQQTEKIPISIKPVFEEKTTGSTQIKKDENAPLIIHEEKPAVEQAKTNENEKQKFFSFSPGFFFKDKPKQNIQNEPVKAVVESSFGFKNESESEKEKQEKRVVHYNELRTPLTPFNKKDEFIKLNAFAPSEKKENVSNLKNEAPKQDQISGSINYKPTEFSSYGSQEKKKILFGFGRQTNPQNTNKEEEEKQKDNAKINGNIVDLSN